MATSMALSGEATGGHCDVVPMSLTTLVAPPDLTGSLIETSEMLVNAPALSECKSKQH